jgi:hypothetical protein
MFSCSTSVVLFDSNGGYYAVWRPQVIAAPQVLEREIIREKPNKWQGNCPSCGHRYAWDDAECRHCHAQLPAEVEDDKPEPVPRPELAWVEAKPERRWWEVWK